jgi:uncharacterized membrane protein
VGFLVADDLREMSRRSARELVGVFMPTTPNPTSGFIVFLPREDVVELDMSIDQAMKMVLTLGVVTPGAAPAQAELAGVAPADSSGMR